MTQSNKNLTMHHAHTLRLGEMAGMANQLLVALLNVEHGPLDARSKNIHKQLTDALLALTQACSAYHAMLKETGT